MGDAETEVLGTSACWALLRTVEVGRLAVLVDEAPDIFPVNFVVDHGSVVFRTAPGTKLDAALQTAPVAFEADGPQEPRLGVAMPVVRPTSRLSWRR